MIKLMIKSKDEYTNYVLEDNNGKSYDVNINFMEIDIPNIGDYIYIPEKVLKDS